MGDLLADFSDEPQNPTDDNGLLDTSNPFSEPPVQGGSGLDGMLAGSDDDLFTAQAPSSTPGPSQPASALVHWQHEKDAALRDLDARDAQAADELKAKARASLDAFNTTVADSQGKRRVSNAELDTQKIADLQANFGNQWEKVVRFVDFNRSDLHERDVSKFKTLLLQLKH
jgi:hypothetical protein